MAKDSFVARKAQRISLKERISSWKNNRRAREKRINAIRNWNWVAIMKVVAVICFLAASGAFLRYAEAYVKVAAPAEGACLKLVNVPTWVNWDLKNRVAEIARWPHFDVNDSAASSVARRLASMSWLADVNVRVTHDSVLVTARWRKPVVVIDIKETNSKIYVDKDLVVMDYMPMPHLPIVKAKDVFLNIVPPPGQVFDVGDLRAAVDLAEVLMRADAMYAPKTPLMEQIESIDVSNYKGRKSPRREHIVFHAKDGAMIIYGAELGEYAKYGEASDDEKLAALYGYYKESGSFGSEAKYINVRLPQNRVHLPIDSTR
jgi:hypothetical protein